MPLCRGLLTSAAARFSAPAFLVLFTIVNVLNYIDRGIVPGAFSSMGSFIRDDGAASGNSTDTEICVLQSSFVVGYSVSSLGLGHAAQTRPPFKLMAGGLAVWCVAAILSGLAPHYWVLVLARALSGVGEASFQTVVPPFIEDTAPSKQRGLFLSIFYCAIPVGTAMGYGIGGIVPWRWAFFGEAVPMLLLLPLLWALPSPNHSARKTADASDETVAIKGQGTALLTDAAAVSPPTTPSLLKQIMLCLTDPLYMAAVLGYAGFTAVIAGLGSFGPTFVQGLGLLACQSSAFLAFGACICVAGILGTPSGGWWLDKALVREREVVRKTIAPINAQPPNAPVTSSAQQSETQLEVELMGAPVLELTVGGVDNSVRTPNSEAQGIWAGHQRSLVTAPARVPLAPLSDAAECSVQLRVTLRQATALSAVGAAMAIGAAAISGAGVALFFIVLTLGCAALFANTAAVNLSIMAAAPGGRTARPFAIGLGTLLMHALGDVPAPPVIGALAAALSHVSSCPAAESDCVACTRDAGGLRTVLFLVLAWLAWPIALWGAGWLLAQRQHRSLANGAAI